VMVGSWGVGLSTDGPGRVQKTIHPPTRPPAPSRVRSQPSQHAVPGEPAKARRKPAATSPQPTAGAARFVMVGSWGVGLSTDGPGRVQKTIHPPTRPPAPSRVRPQPSQRAVPGEPAKARRKPARSRATAPPNPPGGSNFPCRHNTQALLPRRVEPVGRSLWRLGAQPSNFSRVICARTHIARDVRVGGRVANAFTSRPRQGSER